MAIAGAAEHASQQEAGRENDVELGLSQSGADLKAVDRATNEAGTEEAAEGVEKVTVTGKEWKDATQVIPENRLWIVFIG